MAVPSAPKAEPKPANPAAPASAAMSPEPGKPTNAGFLRRLSTGANVTLQLVALAVILALVNGFSYKHFHRFDFSRDRKNALSDQTKKFLGSLTKPVKVIVFVNTNSQLVTDVTNLLAEYHNVQPKILQVEQVDPYRSLGRATEVQTKYKLGATDSVVLDCEGRTKIIRDENMAEFDNSNSMFGQPPTLTAFTGEQAITSGLIEVSEGKKSTTYYLTGHGESAFGKGQPMELVGLLLEGEHLTTAELNLLNVPTVPADASAVMLLGSRYDLTERELKLLSDYWEKGGRLLILLNPDAATPNLHGFLQRLGITPDDDRVLATVPMGPYTGIVRDTVTALTGTSRLSALLAGVTPVFPGGAQSLTLTPEAGRAGGTKVSPLLVASPKFWGETDYKDLENTGAYDDPKHKHAPLTIAATVEKGAPGDQRLQVGAARMVVVGQAKFVESSSMDERLRDFFVGTVNWLLERESLIGIKPKQKQSYTLNLPEEQITRFFQLAVLAMPAACAVLGAFVWWRRRA